MSIVEWQAGYDSDGEDRRERNDWMIEEAVAAFEDEPSVRHNVYPDLDEEEAAQRKARRRDHIRRGNGSLYLGQVFISGIAFKEGFLDYALKTGYNISQKRYDKTKLVFKCLGENCTWRIYCSRKGGSSMWQVPVIARLFVDKIREEPEYFMPMKIEELVMEKWKISVSRPQCKHTRNKALAWIEREYEEQFARLIDYAKEIEGSNPDSSVEVDCIVNDQGQHVFQRFYVCFDNLQKSWKENCRPMLGVDGCFLKTVHKGELFVASGRDADNRIYHVAWAVVQKENADNWDWFFSKIRDDLGLHDGDGFVLISDRQKGLISAVQRILPKIKHRMSWRYNEPDFRENLNKIELYDEALYRDLLKTKPETWCRAFYKLGSYCEDVENNSVESFNNSIGKARDKALVPMLETIARLAMVRIAKRYYKASNYDGFCTSYVKKYLAEYHDAASGCFVWPSTNMQYACSLDGCTHRVDLANRTCSCRRREITGIPCEHAYGVILKKGLEAQHYVCHWFGTDKWRRLYIDGIVPVRGAKFWPRGEEPSIVHPEIPNMPGGKKDKDKAKEKVTKQDKKRKRDRNESPTRRADPLEKKRVMHCGVCGAAGHNSRWHNKKKKGSTSEVPLLEASSQVEPSQGILSQVD
ncbi:uncharacterized protein LOC112088051 [Eutrema salsugineum]|uniref:uncharacterized protein LOC112088051 n=1 Tax=Eutrema salsugineum TaxID=72664 RepID=UPI000CED5C6C|nr:uncharacterized protein LOC112088051 [Eutrema salsugineum]